MGEPIGRTLGGLAEFIQGLGNLNDPDKRKRQAVQQAILEDPTKAQEYSQLSPEALQALIGKARTFGSNNSADLIKSIQNTPLTGKRLEEKQKSDAINLANDNNSNAAPQQALNPFEAYKVNQLGGSNSPLTQQANQNPFDALSQSQNPGTDLLTQNTQQVSTPIAPTLKNSQAEDVRRKSLGLPTQVESKAEEQRLANEQRQGKLQDTQLDLNNFNLAELKSDKGKGDLTQNYIKNDKSGRTAYQIYSDPNTPADIKEGFTADKKLYDAVNLGREENNSSISHNFQQKTYDLQKLMASNKYNQDQQLLLGKIHVASELGPKIGVNPKVISDIFDNPELRKKYAGVDPSTVADPQEREYATAVRGLDNISGHYDKSMINKMKSTFEQERVRIQTQADEGKITPNEAINNINTAAQLNYGAYGLAPPKFDYNSTTFFPSLDPKAHANPLGQKGTKFIITDPGDAKLGYKNEGSVSPEEASQAKAAQDLINNGQATYENTVNDPRASRIKHLLTPPKVKK